MKLSGFTIAVVLFTLLLGCKAEAIKNEEQQSFQEIVTLEEQLWPEVSAVGMERLYSAKDSDTQKWGYVDRNGVWVIQATYERTATMAGDIQTFPYLLVKENSNWGYINVDEKWIIPPTYRSMPSFRNGFLWIAEEGSVAQPVDHTGKPVDRRFAQSFAEGIGLQFESSSNTNQAVGYVRENGEWVIPPQFYIMEGMHVYTYIFAFSDGIALMMDGNRFGFIDRNGVWIGSTRYDNALPFAEGLAAVAVHGKWGFINETADFAQYIQTRSFSEGVAAVCNTDGLWGFINTQGKWIIEPKFDSVDTGLMGLDHTLLVFHEGYAIARLNENDTYKYGNRFGYIDMSGEWAIPPQFCYAGQFEDGISYVSVGSGDKETCGYLRKSGEYIASWKSFPYE